MTHPSSINMANLGSSHNPGTPVAAANPHAAENLSPEKNSTTTTSTPKPPDPVSDHLFLNNIRPEQAREFLLNQINRKLDITAPPPIKGAAEYSEEIASTQETSNQIIAVINNVLNNDVDEGTTQSTLISATRKEINHSFSEVKNIFENLNALREEFHTEFDDIQHNVNKYLDNISSNTPTKNLDHAL